MEPAREADGARLQGRALVIIGDDRVRDLLDRGVDRCDPVLLDDIMAQRCRDHPDQFVLELGGQLDLAHGRLLEAVEAAAAGDDQLHRRGGDLFVGIADEGEEQIAVARARRMRLPVAMLLDAADEDVAELAVAQRLGAFEDRKRDRHMGRGERGVERRMRLEPQREAGAQLVLEAAHQPVEQSGGGEPLPLAEPRPIGQQQVGRGDGKALPRRGQQQARSIALSFRPRRSAFRHDFPLAAQG